MPLLGRQGIEHRHTIKPCYHQLKQHLPITPVFVTITAQDSLFLPFMQKRLNSIRCATHRRYIHKKGSWWLTVRT
jgi:hypothetical protein